MISIIIFVILQCIALAHLAWAIGIVWPGKSEAELVRIVVGSPNYTKMPPYWTTLIVAICISGVGFLAFWNSQGFGLPEVLQIGAAMVFLMRGLITYYPSGPFRNSIEPFNTLNRLAFSPLCLGLAAGFAFLILNN